MPRKNSRAEGYESPIQNNVPVACHPRSREPNNFLRSLEARRLKMVEKDSRMQSGSAIIPPIPNHFMIPGAQDFVHQ